MVEIPFLIVSTTCLQIYILAAIFFLTCRIVTPRLTQIPTSFMRQDYVTKRGLFIIYIGFFEMVFVLIVHVELSRQILSIVQPVEKHCSEFLNDRRMNFVSYVVLACILLSVVRCLVQRYVLERLSKPDVVSMTRVYLLPSTYFIALLCIRLWFHLYEEPDLIQPNPTICYQKVKWPTAVVKNSPVIFYFFIMTFITINFIYDFAVSRCEPEPGLPSYGYFCSYFIRQKRSSMKHTVLGRQSTHLQIRLIESNGKLSHSSLLGIQESRIQAPIMSATPYSTSGGRIEQNYAKSDKSRRMHFPGDTLKVKAPSSCGSLWEFLSRSVRLYIALAVYFAIFVGCYQCTAYLLVGSFLEDFIPVIFTSVVVLNGILRAVQIAFAATINDEKLHLVVNCKNQSSV